MTELNHAADGDREITEVSIVFDGYRNAPHEGEDPATVWISRGRRPAEGKTGPAIAAAIVTLSETGESWTAMGWTPDGPCTLKSEAAYDDAVASALRHARRIAAGTVEDQWARRQAEQKKLARSWKTIVADRPPETGDPSTWTGEPVQ